jgi:hypothetical protein
MKMTSAGIDAKIAADAPPQDSAFAKSIVGEQKTKEFDKPWWTGWKSPMGGLVWLHSGLERTDEIEIPEGLEGYCGQWCCFLDKPQRVVYVNVPGMESGVIPAGSTLEIGTERVSKETPVEELERFIEQGYHKLIELMAAEKSKAA